MESADAMKYLVIPFTANLVALLAADYLIAGFELSRTLTAILGAAGLLTLLNLVIKPIVKFILAPLIILTLGFFTIIINVTLLLALDFFSDSLKINGLLGLVLAALLISAINLICHARRPPK